MRLINKYKHYTKPLIIVKNYPEIRILKFKHAKWQKTQIFFKKKTLLLRSSNHRSVANKKIFFDNSFQLLFYTRWAKLSSSYKQSLTLKQSILTYYDQSVPLPYFKNQLLKEKNKKRLFLLTLIKPLFRLDILLWKLNIFNSIYNARHFIYNGLVNINFNKITQICSVKKGDVINFSSSFHNSALIVSKNFDFLSSFLEYDKYSNTIVIIKNFSDLPIEDLYLLVYRFIYLNKFINYVKTK